MISKLNLGFGGINDGFNTRVHFVAATRNPLGLCINGIDEVEVEDPDYSCGSPNNGIQLIQNNTWDPKQYMNIFVFQNEDCYWSMLTSQQIEKKTNSSYFMCSKSELEDDVLIYKNSANVYGRSIIHEMYHYFGGHHLDGPGNGVADCHTPAECLDKGDWVCDTKLFHTIISGNDCSDITSRCPDGSTNVVDADNFMARTASCQYKFTEGQAKLLRFSISWASPFIVKDENLNIIAPIETEFYSSLPGDDKLITSPTLLSNPNYKTNGNLIIKKGGSLTIGANTTLRMGAGYKIVIEPGAYIRLEGKIKDQCGSPWSGIEVQGEKTINGLLSQGYFYSVSGAQIENAETALKLYGPLITDVGGKQTVGGLPLRIARQAWIFSPMMPVFLNHIQPILNNVHL